MPKRTKRKASIAICPLDSCHSSTEIDGHIYGEHFVKVGTHHGLSADFGLFD